MLLFIPAAQIAARRELGGSKCVIQLVNWAQVEFVIPFAPTQRSSGQEGGADQLDKAGQSILHLLHRAAGIAEENSRHALDMAQKLSHQLRAAKDRIAELELKSQRIRTELSVPSNEPDRFLQQEKRRNGTR